MIRWLPLIKKFPRYAVAAGMIAVTSVVFILWLLLRSSGGGSAGDPTGQIVDLAERNLILCGNALVDCDSGEILSKQWIEGAGQSLPPVRRILKDERLVLVSVNGVTVAFDYDGKPKPVISYEGKNPLSFAVDQGGKEVVFAREGNLWHGKLDWNKSSISEVRKVTDAGFFRDDTFRSSSLWNNGELYVNVLGRPHLVLLKDGSTKPGQPPVDLMQRGLSPDRKFVALSLMSGEFGVAEFATGELKRFPTLGQVTEVIWLSNDRVAVVGHYKRLSIYDHSQGKVIAEYQLESPPQFVGPASPDGKFLLMGGPQTVGAFSIETGEFKAFSHPVGDGAWGSEQKFIGSNDGTDTDLRGVWCVALDGRKERLLSQPFDASAVKARSAVEVPGGMIFVSGGNLWRYSAANNQVKQLTTTGGLQPNLALLQK